MSTEPTDPRPIRLEISDNVFWALICALGVVLCLSLAVPAIWQYWQFQRECVRAGYTQVVLPGYSYASWVKGTK